MKKETGILLATSVGFFSILGVYVYKKLSKAKEMDEKKHSDLIHEVIGKIDRESVGNLPC